MEQHTAEVWIKVIGIVGIVLSAIGVLGGLGFIFGGGALASLFSMAIPGLASIGLGSLFVVAGIIILIISVLMIFLYIYLMKYKNWARIIVFVLAAIGFIGAIFSLPSSIITLIINGGIFYLLVFEKDIIALFTK